MIFRWTLWRKFGNMGLLGLTVSPKKYGGSGMAYLAHIDRHGGNLSARPGALGACLTVPISNLCVNQIHRKR